MTDVLDIHALQQAPENRDARGRFSAGNLAAVRHLLRVQTDPPELVAAHASRVESIAVDLGGMSQLSAVQVPLVTELARLQLITESLGHDVLTRGVLTGKGRTRAAVTVYLSVLDRQQRLATLLGLERRAKPTETLATWAEAHR